ncbi:MAG: ABC transporter permease [Phycisphaera sp.]|nr:ABC transporter permease [Phycisphaera sp.]
MTVSAPDSAPIDTASTDASPTDTPPIPHVVIAPSRGWVALNLAELWRYRELLVFLAWRDIKVRYKQTVLGIAWAVMVPLMTMVVLNVLFGLLMGKNGKPTIEGVPYAVSTFCALVPWQLFSNVIGQSSGSVVGSSNLITKIYFPRLITPLAPVLSCMVDFLIAFAVLLGIIGYFHLFTDYHFVISWALLTLPLWVLLAVAAALSISLWLSALNVVYRDVRYILPFLTQLLMYVSPVIYTTKSVMTGDVPQWIRTVYALNPLVSVMEGFRWALLGRSDPPGFELIPSTAMVAVLLVGGLYYFRRMERTFADVA